MEVKFTPTVDDLLELQKFKLDRRPKNRYGPLLRSLPIAVATALVAGILAHLLFVQALPIACLSLIVALPVESWATKWLRRDKMRAWAAKNPAFLSEITVNIDAEGFRMKNQAQDDSLTWKAVYDLVENRPYIYLLAGPAAATLIPERAFGSPDELRHFLDLARSYRNSAKASPESK